MEEIKKILGSFAQFYGQECWQNGKQGIRKLPSGEEFINMYTDELAKILSKQGNIIKPLVMLDDEGATEPIQDALYATGRFTTDECDILADGILTYIRDRKIMIANGYALSQ